MARMETFTILATKSILNFSINFILNFFINFVLTFTGIKKCRFYDLRGSYATSILNNGTEIRDVADILGHRNIETTENYYISSTSETRKAANDSFDRMMSSDVIDMVSRISI